MPYVEFLLHIEASALRQLAAMDAITLGFTSDPHAELIKSQLRTLAHG